jgi:hypothetical protein
MIALILAEILARWIDDAVTGERVRIHDLGSRTTRAAVDLRRERKRRD